MGFLGREDFGSKGSQLGNSSLAALFMAMMPASIISVRIVIESSFIFHHFTAEHAESVVPINRD